MTADRVQLLCKAMIEVTALVSCGVDVTGVKALRIDEQSQKETWYGRLLWWPPWKVG